MSISKAIQSDNISEQPELIPVLNPVISDVFSNILVEGMLVGIIALTIYAVLFFAKHVFGSQSLYVSIQSPQEVVFELLDEVLAYKVHLKRQRVPRQIRKYLERIDTDVRELFRILEKQDAPDLDLVAGQYVASLKALLSVIETYVNELQSHKKYFKSADKKEEYDRRVTDTIRATKFCADSAHRAVYDATRGSIASAEAGIAYLSMTALQSTQWSDAFARLTSGKG